MTTRRKFLAANLMGAAGFAANPAQMLSSPIESASIPVAPEGRSDRNFWNDWPDYLVQEMNRAQSKRAENLSAVHSIAQAQERATTIHSQLWKLIGGPLDKTPLNAHVTGSVEREHYRIENVVFESHPEVYVTANLYIPTTGKPPYPAILAPVGHVDEGKAYRNYQYLYQNLARKGFVVFSYDPFGQGERFQYLDPATGLSRYGPWEHMQAGRPLILLAETFALYRTWDGIRALDYLVSRPEVDEKRIGCTGHSGGGTMTMYLAALEPRIQAAVVIEGNTENMAEPFFDPPGAIADAEQNIVEGLPLGVDRGDLLWGFAPKPLLICYTTHDAGETYAPLYEEGTKEIYGELQSVYGLYSAEEKVALYASHLPHEMDFLIRAQTYGWFNQWLGNANAGADEAEFEVIPQEQLNATSTGEVLTSLGGRSVVQLTADRARTMMPESPFQNAAGKIGPVRDKIHDELLKLLALPPDQQLPLQSRVRSTNRCKSVVMEEIQFESQPGVRIPGWFVAPLSGKKPFSTVLYLTDTGGETIVAEPGSMDRLLAEGYAVCAISLRGLGITMPRPPHGGPNFYGTAFRLDERLAWASLVLGMPVIGQRVWDALQAIRYLASRPDVDPLQIRLLGTGGAGLAALMAGFIDKRPRSVLLNQTLVSYASILELEDYSLKLSWFVPGILRKFDLPDLAVGVSPRSCWILNGVDSCGQMLSETAMKERYRQRFHDSASLWSNVRFLASPEHEAPERYLEWLKST